LFIEEVSINIEDDVIYSLVGTRPLGLTDYIWKRVNGTSISEKNEDYLRLKKKAKKNLKLLEKVKSDEVSIEDFDLLSYSLGDYFYLENMSKTDFLLWKSLLMRIIDFKGIEEGISTIVYPVEFVNETLLNIKETDNSYEVTLKSFGKTNKIEYKKDDYKLEIMVNYLNRFKGVTQNDWLSLEEWVGKLPKIYHSGSIGLALLLLDVQELLYFR
jgi:hypothetical protein